VATTKRALTLAVALWLVISPVLLGYEGDAPAVHNGLWLALFAAVIAIAEGLRPRLAVVQAALGVWLAVSPLLLGYGTAAGRLNHLAAGLAVVALTPVSRRWRSRQERDAGRAARSLPAPQLREPS